MGKIPAKIPKEDSTELRTLLLLIRYALEWAQPHHLMRKSEHESSYIIAHHMRQKFAHIDHALTIGKLSSDY